MKYSALAVCLAALATGSAALAHPPARSAPIVVDVDPGPGGAMVRPATEEERRQVERHMADVGPALAMLEGLQDLSDEQVERLERRLDSEAPVASIVADGESVSVYRDGTIVFE